MRPAARFRRPSAPGILIALAVRNYNQEMRSAVAAFLFPLLLSSAELRIDHATIAGTNLRTLQDELSSIGIPTVYGGTHTSGGTEMAIASFPDGSYLELMALRAKATPEEKSQNSWIRFLEGDAGPCAWAVREDDMPAAIKRLREAGIAVSDPQRMGRRRTDGVQLEWEMSSVGKHTRGTFFPFLIHDFTPHDQRAFPQGKPVTRNFERVAMVVIAVRNLDEAVRLYQDAYHTTAKTQSDQAFGAKLAKLENLPVVLAQPLLPDSWLARRIARFGEAPCAIVLSAKSLTHPGISQTRWFGDAITWFDPAKMGWRLGVATE